MVKAVAVRAMLGGRTALPMVMVPFLSVAVLVVTMVEIMVAKTDAVIAVVDGGSALPMIPLLSVAVFVVTMVGIMVLMADAVFAVVDGGNAFDGGNALPMVLVQVAAQVVEAASVGMVLCGFASFQAVVVLVPLIMR